MICLKDWISNEDLIKMDLELNYFVEKFDQIDINNLKHYNRKGILSDYWLGFLESFFIYSNDELPIDKKKIIAKEMLYNTLKRKTSFDPFDALTLFYRQNSRDNLNEITKYKKLFPELLKIVKLLELGLTDIITDCYYKIRRKLESKNKDWSLYHVIINPDFQKYLKMIEIEYLKTRMNY